MATYSQSLIPIMTSVTAPTPYIISASAQAGTGTASWMAFNRDATTYWRSSTAAFPHWISVSVGTGSSIKVNKYTIIGSNTHVLIRSPKDWIFQGSNDGVVWIDLHTVTNETDWILNTKKEYVFSNSIAYKSYRLLIQSSISDTSYVDISSIELFENLTIEKHLIKSSNKIHILAENKMIETFLSEPLSKADFETYGMNDLSLFNSQMNKLVLPMTSEVLGDGKIYRKTLNISDFDTLEVK